MSSHYREERFLQPAYTMARRGSEQRIEKGQPGVPEAPPNWPDAQGVCNNSRLERSPKFYSEAALLSFLCQSTENKFAKRILTMLLRG
jgi:hypothetical protein